MTRRREQPTERGATLVEYALVLSLFVVVIMASIGSLQESGRDELDSGGQRVGDVTDGAYYATPGGGGGPPPPPPPTTAPPPPPPSNVLSAQSITPNAPSQGSPASKWIASASIRVIDGDGQPVSGVVVTVQFALSGPGSQPAVRTCTTDASGICSVQENDINDNRTQATITIVNMTKIDYVLSTDPQPNQVIDCTTVAGVCG